jgi:bile acid-coenzyme A ligase
MSMPGTRPNMMSQCLCALVSVGKIGETARLRIIGDDGNDVVPDETGEIYFLPNGGPGTTYHYLGAEPKRIA